MKTPEYNARKFRPFFPAAYLIAGAAFLLCFGFQKLRATSETASSDKKVFLQLKWHHQFQFAGYYAAQAKGYYRDEGLDVVVLEGGREKPPIPHVLEGQAQYGVGDSDILLARLEGKPLVALAAIFQHSPYIFMSRKDHPIRNPRDLVGAKVMLSDDQGAAQLKTLLIKAGIKPDSVLIVPHSWNLEDLIAARVDAISAYAMVEPNRLRSKGIEPVILRSIDFGVDFYGDTLFTTTSELQDHPERVAAMRRASLKGWHYALQHPEELCDLILKMEGVAEKDITRQMLLQEAKDMMPYILPDVVELGHMNLNRWRKTARAFADLKMAPTNSVPEGFLYEAETEQRNAFVRILLKAGVLLAGITLAVTLWNSQIRRKVKKQTEELRQAEERYQRQRDAIIGLMQSKIPSQDELLPVFRLITETAAKTLHVSRVSIWRYQPDGKTGRCIDLYELDKNQHSSGMEVDCRLYPAYINSLEKTDVLATVDARTDPRTAEFLDSYLTPFDIRSQMEVPIFLAGRLEGVLSHEQTGSTRSWKTDEKSFALALANFVILALERQERRKAEEKIIENERMLATLLGNLPGMVYRCKHDECMTMEFISEGSRELLGYSPQDFLSGGPLSFIHLIHPEDRKTVQNEVKKALLLGNQFDLTYRILTNKNQIRWVWERGTAARDTGGQVRFLEGFITDITEKKNLEKQFLRAQRVESIGTLAGGIAHDLNNVLTPITMATDLLKSRQQDSEQLKLLNSISESARRGAEMIGQVLSFARGVEGRRLVIHLKDLLQDIEKIIRDTFPKNILIQIELSSETETLIGDPTQLHQVILNLCVNARDAMPDGGELHLSTGKAELDVHYASMNPDAKTGPHLVIYVRDNGTGISPGTLEKIFDPFFTTKELGQGTGLGLSTSLAIVKSHEGFIRVSSEPGKGSQFSIYLPSSTSPRIHGELPEEIVLPRGNGETILVVDDEPSIRQVTRQTLEAFGYRVMLASDGAEAVAHYAKCKKEIHLVLTDMLMPVMDGPACVQVLLKMNPKVLIIAASGISAYSGNASKLLAAGVKHFLPKPYTADSLLKALKHVLHPNQNHPQHLQ